MLTSRSRSSVETCQNKRETKLFFYLGYYYLGYSHLDKLFTCLPCCYFGHIQDRIWTGYIHTHRSQDDQPLCYCKQKLKGGQTLQGLHGEWVQLHSTLGALVPEWADFEAESKSKYYKKRKQKNDQTLSSTQMSLMSVVWLTLSLSRTPLFLNVLKSLIRSSSLDNLTSMSDINLEAFSATHCTSNNHCMCLIKIHHYAHHLGLLSLNIVFDLIKFTQFSQS